MRRAERERKNRTAAALVVIVCIAALAMNVGLARPASAGVASQGSTCATLNVPSQYPTIQSAIDAANPCDTILVAPGTYFEQLTIDKSISIVGAGAGATVLESPATLLPDAYGNPWTIELGNAATATLTGFTLVVTLQCIGFGYAGGGIGVGGGAYLTLASAVVTTTGLPEGAACTGGLYSYGTGLEFGLDYAVGSPPSSALLGFGTVAGVTVSGFGFLGPGVGVGGLSNSPAGSSAVLAMDRISSSVGDVCPGVYGLCIPAVLVNNGGSAAIDHNYLTGLPGFDVDAVDVMNGAYAAITHNVIVANTMGNGVTVAFSASASIEYNSITAGTSYNGGIAVLLYGSGDVTISHNVIGDFECAYNSTLAAAGVCGPNFADQFQAGGIMVLGPTGTVVESYNLVYNVDAAISGCANCLVAHNLIMNSYDYALMCMDGSCSFGPNLVLGGAYGVAAIAYSANTAVTLSHVVIVGTSVAPFYYEVDFPGGSATIGGS